MKGLYLRGNIWWVRFTPVPGAAQERISLDTDDEAEAIVKARGLKVKAAEEMRGIMESCTRERDLYLADMRAQRAHRNPTSRSRKSILTSFIKSLKVSTPKQITAGMVQAWIAPYQSQNPDTAVMYLAAVKHWLKWLVERRKINYNPASKVKLPKRKPKGRRSFLLPDQARALIDASSSNNDLRFAIYCALHAGMRLMEVVESRPDWFDLETNLIHIQSTPTFEPKDSDNRTVPLTKEFGDWLRDHYGLPSPFMLAPTRTHGKSQYRYDLSYLYQKLLKQLNFGKHFTFHDLRRTFASLHVSRGTSVYKVAQWLGDGVEIVQRSYGHLLPQDDQINDIWETTQPPAAPL